MKGQIRRVATNQPGIHRDLLKVLELHREAPFRRPIARHTQAAFEESLRIFGQQHRPLILDSCCGVGESTQHFARQFPDHFVLGIDKSEARLRRVLSAEGEGGENLAFVRADVIDFWRLAVKDGWQIDRHYLLYPNPWPKQRQLKRRFHGHPVFFDLLQLSAYLELRSNWRIYLEEFSEACHFALGQRPAVTPFQPDPPITPFERKFQRNGQELYRSILQRPGSEEMTYVSAE